MLKHESVMTEAANQIGRAFEITKSKVSDIHTYSVVNIEKKCLKNVTAAKKQLAIGKDYTYALGD